MLSVTPNMPAGGVMEQLERKTTRECGTSPRFPSSVACNAAFNMNTAAMDKYDDYGIHDNLSVIKIGRQYHAESDSDLSTLTENENMNLTQDGQYRTEIDGLIMAKNEEEIRVLDVAELLQAKVAYVAGSCTEEGFPIVTLPDCPTFNTISDKDFLRLMTYLTTVPSLQEVDLGFVIIVDRREDKWSSIKNALGKIAGYFPGTIREVFVLRPSGFLQRTFTDVGFKFYKDEFKFKVFMLESLKELHDHIHKSKLTAELEGNLPYNHQEWIEMRVAIEKFSDNCDDISNALKSLGEQFMGSELPSDVQGTGVLLTEHRKQRYELKEDLHSAIQLGGTLLNCIRKSTTDNANDKNTPMHRFSNSCAIQRLLLQLGETDKAFDVFWSDHESKLKQCLQLREFEQEFQEVKSELDTYLENVNAMTELGDTVARVELLIRDYKELNEKAKLYLERSEKMRCSGEQMVSNKHYAAETIQPKCEQLKVLHIEVQGKLEKRGKILDISLDLQQRIEKANKWCSKGVDLLATQSMDKCQSPEGAESALQEIDDFIKTANQINLHDPKEFRAIFDPILTAEAKEDLYKTTVQHVLQRVDDVKQMFDKRRISLKKLSVKLERPVQAVQPAVPALKSQALSTSLTSLGGTSTKATPPPSPSEAEFRKQKLRKAKSAPKLNRQIEIVRDDAVDASSTSTDDSDTETDTLANKRRHVMKELIDTERVYVTELQSIIEGYEEQMDNSELEHLIPPLLKGKKDVLFANLDEIQEFHKDVFVVDLENCRDTPPLVGRCFVSRRNELDKLYSCYCQNKPQSEILRRECGNDNQFFQECQKRLQHRLPLSAYLLKPVQRITKYQLLLKEMLKFSHNEEGYEALEEAMETMLHVLKYVNDSMHQLRITGFDGNLSEQGKLLMQGSFSVWLEHKKNNIRDLRFKPMQRHLFLYEKSVLFCKKRDDDGYMDKTTYSYKNSIKMTEYGMTENVKADKKKFELWCHGRSEVYVIQAPTVEVKTHWVREIRRVLQSQFEVAKATRRKSSTDQVMQNMQNANTSRPPGSPNPRLTVSKSESVGPNGNGNVVRRHSRSPSMDRANANSSPLPPIEGAVGPDSDNEGWSTDEFTDEEYSVGDRNSAGRLIKMNQYIVLAEYNKIEDTELSMKEGDIVEVMKVGKDGWWFVRQISNKEQGWVPASYLESLAKRASRSSASMGSQGSGNGITFNL
ncbi:guanine nucleotide exchange factor DBS-like isoform X3 [Ptychodera flava]|uniref:guanine nucleotide exchange factor DBS-like isoform X3 n=2 Tax=Ptychodera flava TaxID=63121 RepID=UPI00396A0995